jgi:serine/threonine protein kinase
MKRAPSAQAQAAATGSASTPPVRPDQPRSVRVKASVPGHFSLLDQAYNFFCELRYNGTPVDPEEFCARYPLVQDSLVRLIQAHRFMEENVDLVDVGELEEEEWPEPGDSFAGFHLERKLGEGAIARVYQAVEPALGRRRVALKISRYGGAEAATLGRIPHPNVVPVFSVVHEDESGLTAVCMPYLGSATLQNVLDHVYGDPVPAQQATAVLEAIRDPVWTDPTNPPGDLRAGSYVDGVRYLAIQLADALAFIHGKEIYHRDLKPSNILMRPDGTPMLLDFNLASDFENPQARQGGTPLYMSPEHLSALTVLENGTGARVAVKIEASSDLFSLGVILYELLTGKHPFGPLPLKVKTRELMNWLVERQGQGIRPIREIRPEVDRALAQVVEKCLAPDPRNRPQTAAEVASVLRLGQSLRARAGRWLLRRRMTVAAACLVLATVAVAAVYHVSTRPPEYVVWDQQGRVAFEQRDHQLASDHFTASLRANPKQPEVFFARGRAYLRLASADKEYIGLAMADFTQADELAPAGRNKAFCAYCLQMNGQVLVAIHKYEGARKEGFDSAEMSNNLARLYLDRKELEKAKENLDNALKLNPRLQAAYYNQAEYYFEKANRLDLQVEKERMLKEAIGSFRQATALGPVTGKMALFGAGLCARACQYDSGWLAPALEYLERSIELGVNPQSLNSGLFAFIANDDGYKALCRRTPPANHPPISAIRTVELTVD